jgi:endonuclease/exonuclease/phosphatase family metal-dependent hydrolase
MISGDAAGGDAQGAAGSQAASGNGTGGSSAGNGNAGVSSAGGNSAGGASPEQDAGASYAPVVKVVSFNLRHGAADDGDDSWSNRRELTLSVIQDLDADLIGMQEALFFQLEEIDAELAGYARIGVGRNDAEESGEFSAIYYRTARFDVADSGTFWFSDTPDAIGSTSFGNTIPRICTWGHFVESDTGYGLFVYNVHLDHQSQASRELSTALLMQRASQRGAPDPLLVTGDFNAGEDNLATLFMKGLETVEEQENPLPLLDSFRVLHPDEPMVGTAHGFDGNTEGAKIDYVFVEPGHTVLSAEILHTNDDGRYPSDHFPVTATVRLPGAGTPD